MGAVSIYSSGMVTGVGLDAPSSCAAMRVGITGFVETRFMFDGEWLQGCPVQLEEDWRGVDKLERMAALAIEECLASAPDRGAGDWPLLLCVAEPSRAGRFADLDANLLGAVESRTGRRFHADSRLIADGRIGGAKALNAARELVRDGHAACLVVGVDTFLTAQTLASYDDDHRLVTEGNSNGFIPGEAAAAVLVGPVRRRDEPQMMCLGLGFGNETAPIDSGEPLRADGLVEALRAAFADGKCDYGDIDFRITDNNGEAYGFKESALLVARTLRDLKDEFDIWHPIDCIGEIGAAAVPVMLGVALAAAEKDYAPGPGALCHVGSDRGERAVFILKHRHWSDA